MRDTAISVKRWSLLFTVVLYLRNLPSVFAALLLLYKRFLDCTAAARAEELNTHDLSISKTTKVKTGFPVISVLFRVFSTAEILRTRTWH